MAIISKQSIYSLCVTWILTSWNVLCVLSNFNSILTKKINKASWTYSNYIMSLVSKLYSILQKTRILIQPCQKKSDPNPSLFKIVHNTIPEVKKRLVQILPKRGSILFIMSLYIKVDKPSCTYSTLSYLWSINKY